MKHEIYNTELHLVEIEKSGSVTGTFTEVWSWEITIADFDIPDTDKSIYKGKAVVGNKKISLNWRELESMNPLTEMIDVCKRYMDNR